MLLKKDETPNFQNVSHLQNFKVSVFAAPASAEKEIGGGS